MTNNTTDDSSETNGFCQAMEESLLAMIDDITDWINDMLQLKSKITSNEFFESIDDGVILCQLCHHITNEANKYKTHEPDKNSIIPCVKCLAVNDILGVPVNYVLKKYHKKSKNVSQSRDNISQFLQWAVACGIPSTIRFETNGLVYKKERRNVVLTLYYIGIISYKYGLCAPKLVEMEDEIERQKLNESRSIDLLNKNENVVQGEDDEEGLQPKRLKTGPNSESTTSLDQCSVKTLEEEVEEEENINESNSTTVDENKCPSKDPSPPPKVVSSKKTKPKKQNSKTAKSQQEPFVPKSEVDHMVKDLIDQCKCAEKITLKRVSEGVYKINNFKVYLRLLKSTVMVRVGGGWSSLAEYLEKHDACRMNRIGGSLNQLAPVNPKYKMN